MEARYGKEIPSDLSSWPASVQNANGKVIKRPKAFSSLYKDQAHKLTITALYNSQRLVTEVDYRSTTTQGLGRTQEREICAR